MRRSPGRVAGSRSTATVVVGLSGGVDSAVAALLLKESGYDVIGVTLILASPVTSLSSANGRSSNTVDRARAVAEQLDIPHHVFDWHAAFQKQVIDYFISEYAAGRTPNPCVKCNSRVRFGALLEAGHKLGADLVATGHYARLRGSPVRVSRGVDHNKDQSYVLAEVEPRLLERCIFPLGGYRKEEVRAMAADVGLKSVVSAESQEICFVPNDDYRAFLRGVMGERPGLIVDEHGQELAAHTGTYNFTIGQRKGLGVGGGQPLYVMRVDAEKARVTVGPTGGGDRRAVLMEGIVIHRPTTGGRLYAQVRSTGGPVRGKLSKNGVFLADGPLDGVAAGQTIALYKGDDLLLGATIAGARCVEAAVDRPCGIFSSLEGR